MRNLPTQSDSSCTFLLTSHLSPASQVWPSHWTNTDHQEPPQQQLKNPMMMILTICSVLMTKRTQQNRRGSRLRELLLTTRGKQERRRLQQNLQFFWTSNPGTMRPTWPRWNQTWE